MKFPRNCPLDVAQITKHLHVYTYVHMYEYMYVSHSSTHSSCLGRLAAFPSIVTPDAAMYMFLLACEHSPPSLPPSL